MIGISHMNIYLDSNVWNFLYENNVWLPDHFSESKYKFFITKELKFEIHPIPPDKSALKDFISKSFKAAHVQVDSIFGFGNDNLSASEQRVGGFDEGRFISDEEANFLDLLRHHLNDNKKKKSKLYSNEADISIAIRSIHSVVLTLDNRKGPLLEAKNHGGNVVFLNNFNGEMHTLEEYILANIQKC